MQTQPEVLARHSGEAALAEKAVGYFLKAGQQAMARWAMTEAVAQLRKGLEFLSGVPHETLRKERELDLQIMLGQALVATKGYGADEPAETYARARDLCRQLNRPAQLGQVLWGYWVFRHVRAELERAERHSGGDPSPGRGPERHDVAMFWLRIQRGHLLISWQVHRRPRLLRESPLLMERKLS